MHTITRWWCDTPAEDVHCQRGWNARLLRPGKLHPYSENNSTTLSPDHLHNALPRHGLPSCVACDALFSASLAVFRCPLAHTLVECLRARRPLPCATARRRRTHQPYIRDLCLSGWCCILLAAGTLVYASQLELLVAWFAFLLKVYRVNSGDVGWGT